MTNEQLYEILGDISEKHIIEAKEMQNSKIVNFKKTEEKTMNKNVSKFFKRPTVAVASLALCVCLTGVTALAATGKLQGFFKDIFGFNGAVIGTAYEQATDEIDISVVDVSDKLSIKVDMIASKAAPYDYFETFGIESYKIVDMNGSIIVDGDTTDMVEVADRTATVIIPLDDVSEGEYKLIISEMVGGSKADQPLVLSGTWECEFAVE